MNTSFAIAVLHQKRERVRDNLLRAQERAEDAIKDLRDATAREIEHRRELADIEAAISRLEQMQPVPDSLHVMVDP